MKKFSLIFICAFGAAFGQSVADYSLIAVDAKSKDFVKNDYGMVVQLTKLLVKKNYTVLGTDKFSWPLAAQNPCNLITANIVNTSSMLKNKVAVDFRDCNDKSLAKYEGASLEKEFEIGYPDALAKACVQIPNSHGQHAVTENIPVPQTLDQRGNLSPGTHSEASAAEIFLNNSLRLSRIIISPQQFILANPNTSVPYAVFHATTRPDVFRVQLQSGEQTIGYYENKNLVVELPAADGNYRKEVFYKQ